MKTGRLMGLRRLLVFLVLYLWQAQGLVYPVSVTGSMGPPIQNIDLPQMTKDYDVSGYIIVAQFYPVATMGPCRIIPQPLSYGKILIIRADDVYTYSCFLYGAVALFNGWARDCPDGTNTTALQLVPGIVPCSTKANRPAVALYIQVGPVTKFCCLDPLIGPITAVYPQAMIEIDRANLFPRTGISIADFSTLYASFPANQTLLPIRITNEGSIEEGTRLLNSFGMKFWYIQRLILDFLLCGWQIYVMRGVRRNETGKWRINMKWGMILGTFAWTLAKIGADLIYIRPVADTFPLTAPEIFVNIPLIWVGFSVGFIAFCCMLLLWLKLAHMNLYNRYGRWATIAYEYFVKVSMFYMPVLMISWAIYFSELGRLVNTTDIRQKFFISIQWARGLSILTGVTLCIHSIGFLYYGQRIINAANEAKQYAAPQGSQIASVASAHSQVGVASGVQARSELMRSPSTVSKPPRSVSATVRWLSYVVAVGWVTMGLWYIIPSSIATKPALTFYSGAFWYDIEYYGIVLASTFLISGGFGATERRGTSQSQSQDNRPSLKGDSKKKLAQDVFREDKIKASSSGDV